MLKFRNRFLIYLTAVSAGALLISNLAAVKLWNLFGIAVDGGCDRFFAYLYYRGSDSGILWKEDCQKCRAGRAAGQPSSPCLSLASSSLCQHTAAGACIGAYASVLGFAPRVIAGSLAGYVSANLFNNFILHQDEERPRLLCPQLHRPRAGLIGLLRICSILPSLKRSPFLGVLSFPEFLAQALFAYVLGIGLELILSPLEAWIASKLRGRLSAYQNDNRFSFEVVKRIPGKLDVPASSIRRMGDIKTPAFMSVGTKGEVRFVSMEDLKQIGAQAMSQQWLSLAQHFPGNCRKRRTGQLVRMGWADHHRFRRLPGHVAWLRHRQGRQYGA